MPIQINGSGTTTGGVVKATDATTIGAPYTLEVSIPFAEFAIGEQYGVEGDGSIDFDSDIMTVDAGMVDALTGSATVLFVSTIGFTADGTHVVKVKSIGALLKTIGKLEVTVTAAAAVPPPGPTPPLGPTPPASPRPARSAHARTGSPSKGWTRTSRFLQKVAILLAVLIVGTIIWTVGTIGGWFSSHQETFETEERARQDAAEELKKDACDAKQGVWDVAKKRCTLSEAQRKEIAKEVTDLAEALTDGKGEPTMKDPVGDLCARLTPRKQREHNCPQSH